MVAMRAKMKIIDVTQSGGVVGGSEVLNFTAVSKSEAYPEDGSDENNTYAMWTPTADLQMQVNNPALLGKFKIGEEYYLDFTKAS